MLLDLHYGRRTQTLQIKIKEAQDSNIILESNFSGGRSRYGKR